jgi:hypothetical protein
MTSGLDCIECGSPHNLERPLPKHGLCDRCEDIYQAEQRWQEIDDEVEADRWG